LTLLLIRRFTYAYRSLPAPDTAQAYRNEAEAGKAIKESGLAREDIFVTTKYSGLGGLDIETSIQDSLSKVSLSF
jgi:diketogulonate reductase-like aldo/keto reductase